MITPTTNLADTTGIGTNVLNVNSAWWWQNFGKNERAPIASDSRMGIAGIDPDLLRYRNTAVELSIAGNKSSMVEYTRNGKSEQKSNLSSKCLKWCEPDGSGALDCCQWDWEMGTKKNKNKSNFLISKCYNTCGVLHPFNNDRRSACRAQCDKDAAAAQAQQEQLQQVINQPSPGINSGLIWGIIGGIVVLTIGGVVLIRKMKKKA